MQQNQDRTSKQRIVEADVKRIGNYLVYQDKKIGRGSFGEVLLAKHAPLASIKSEELLACKVINLAGKASTQMKSIEREIEIL